MDAVYLSILSLQQEECTRAVAKNGEGGHRTGKDHLSKTADGTCVTVGSILPFYAMCFILRSKHQYQLDIFALRVQ